MFTFMAGASSMGARVASTTAASRSSAIPAAIRAMASAVAGATIDQIGLVGQADVPDVGLLGEVEQLARHRVPGQGLQRERGDELARRPRHHHPHLGARLAQQAGTARPPCRPRCPR